MLYILGALVAALMFVSGFASCEYKEVIKLKSEKIAAQSLFDERLKQNAVKEREDADFMKTIQGDFDEKLKSLVDANRAFAGKLRDPFRGSCPGSQASSSPGVSQNPSPGSELSDSFTGFLRGEAARADFTAVYATECRKVALRPTIRDQVKELP